MDRNWFNMRFDIITIFPKVFDSYFNESIIKKARVKKLADIYIYDLRKFSRNKHNKVDDRPYGGGPGMVFRVEPVARAVTSLRAAGELKKHKAVIVLFSVSGKQYTQKMARDWAKKYKRIILISGRYEGVDARVKKILKNSGARVKEVSIGPYVLTGGELPAMVVVDSILRHVPGVLGKEESLEESRYGVGLPVYTRPEVFKWKGKKYKTPKVLLLGNHKKINEWRKKYSKKMFQ